MVTRAGSLRLSHPTVKVPRSIRHIPKPVDSPGDTASTVGTVRFDSDDEIVKPEAYRRATTLAVQQPARPLQDTGSMENELFDLSDPFQASKFQGLTLQESNLEGATLSELDDPNDVPTDPLDSKASVMGNVDNASDSRIDGHQPMSNQYNTKPLLDQQPKLHLSHSVSEICLPSSNHSQFFEPNKRKPVKSRHESFELGAGHLIDPRRVSEVANDADRYEMPSEKENMEIVGYNLNEVRERIGSSLDNLGDILDLQNPTRRLDFQASFYSYNSGQTQQSLAPEISVQTLLFDHYLVLANEPVPKDADPCLATKPMYDILALVGDLSRRLHPHMSDFKLSSQSLYKCWSSTVRKRGP